MKFSAVALLALAQGTLAMPQMSDKTNEIAKRSAEIYGRDICWLLCAPEKIECPEQWYASQQGDCWTCCRGIDEE